MWFLMGKLYIRCPECQDFVEVKTGFITGRVLQQNIRCGHNHVIDVKSARMTSKRCPSCGNSVAYDQLKGQKAKCPVCNADLVTPESENNLLHFRCSTCGCNLSAAKDEETVTCPLCESVINVAAQAKLEAERKKGLPSVIKFEGDNLTFVWKHPQTDFVTGSQLIVHETQTAVFFRNGEALDSFPAGRYTLETSVLPKMNSIYRLPVQGQPFHAEIYFVNMTTQMGIKWGTDSKVRLFDPATGLHVELGASGSFNLQVNDPRRLLMRIVGTTDKLTQDQLFGGDIGVFRKMVITKVKGNLGRVIKERNVNILEVDEQSETIGAALKEAINPDLAEYGLQMTEFYVANIVTPDDDENFKRLKQQHADRYLKVEEEHIRKAEAEAAFERKAVEAQTAARMKVIEAQGDAEAYRVQAAAEAEGMRLKGYTYQQETARQIGVEAMRNNGGGNLGALAGSMMQLGVGLGAVGSVAGLTREALAPVSAAGVQAGANAAAPGWNCSCGKAGIMSNFCPDCGGKKPEAQTGWNCACGTTGITSNFCPNCGQKRPAPTWNCVCGERNISSNFCPNCGKKRGE